MKKILRFHKLQTRIVVAFATLLFLVNLAGVLVIDFILSNNATQETEKKLIFGRHLFDFMSEETNQKLSQTASILSYDYAFRQAIGTDDNKTILSVLENHRTRFNANVMFLADLDHKMITDTIAYTKTNEAFPFNDLLITAEQEGKATGIVFFNDHLYKIIIVPVLAPTPIVWLASAFMIDDSYAHYMQSLTGLELSFFSQRKSTNTWQRLATTLPTLQAETLLNALPNIIHTDQNQAFIKTKLIDTLYLTQISILSADKDTIIALVLQKSFRDMLEPLHHLQQLMLILSLFSFFIAVFASTLIAESITLPIRRLVQFAKRIELGDYSDPLLYRHNDEVGQLTLALQAMSKGIAERESKIMLLANFDPLTGLPNRNLFQDRLAQAIKTAKRTETVFSIVIMDLDRFKEINDIMGHHIGDLLLTEVAKRLQAIMPDEDNTLARLGGDEFAMLIPADLERSQLFASNVLNTFITPFILEGQKVIINTSIGLACYPKHAEEANSLLRLADLAMYSAKNNNAGYIVFDCSLDAQDQDYLSLMAELHRAIAENELVLYYQPKLELSTGMVTHAEALIRWNHPKHGLIAPIHFIPFAEKTGFIKSITLWVIEQVLRQQKQLQKMGISLTISVNISADDLFIPKLPALLSEFLQKYQILPDCLILEITESTIMTDPQKAMSILNEIHQLGLRLSIDDFGTGYSSLAYLKKLPVSELKIDKSFVSNMESDRDDAVIVHSTLDLAHNMGLKVVAEGVENAATSAILQALGCDYLQGYYISRPLPIADLINWLRNPDQLTNKNS